MDDFHVNCKISIKLVKLMKSNRYMIHFIHKICYEIHKISYIQEFMRSKKPMKHFYTVLHTNKVNVATGRQFRLAVIIKKVNKVFVA